MTRDEAIAVLAEVERRSRPPFCPHVPYVKQRAFIRLEQEEAGYGGAASGGKSDALLMDPLQYVEQPKYAALFLRKSYADLALPGALLDRAYSWFSQTSARFDGKNNRWTFPSGAVIQFGYMETDADRNRYASAEFQYIAFDEATQHTELRYTFMKSRLRKLVGSTVPLKLRSATNPGGIGHRWYMKRFGLNVDGTQKPEWTELDHEGKPVAVTPALRPFIKARRDDNPAVDQESYGRQLAGLDATTRKQLDLGLWVLDEGLVYPFTPSNVISAADLPRFPGWQTVFVVDLGAREDKPTTGFGLLMFHEHDPVTYVRRAWKERSLTPSDVADICKEVQRAHPECLFLMDEGALGKGYGNELRRRHGLPVKAAEKSKRRAFIRFFNGGLQDKLIKVVGADCADLLEEWSGLVWDDDGQDIASGLDDHCSDAVLYGWRWSRSFASEAPATTPPHGTPEWMAAEAARLEQAERDRWAESQTGPAWERW